MAIAILNDSLEAVLPKFGVKAPSFTSTSSVTTRAALYYVILLYLSKTTADKYIMIIP